MFATIARGQSLTPAQCSWIETTYERVIARRTIKIRTVVTNVPAVPADDVQAEILARAGFASFALLARAAGTRPQTLDAVRRGSRGLTDSLLTNLAAALRMNPDRVAAILGSKVKRRARRPSRTA
jgi:hypothetical protein